MLELSGYFLEREIGEQTQRSYKFFLNTLAEWSDKNNVPFGVIDETLFRMFLEDRGENWRDNARYLAYCAARSYCRWRFGDSHPMCHWRLRRKKTAPQRSLNRQQVYDLLTSFDTTTLLGTRNLAIVSLALDTGLRRTELANIAVNQVDPESRRLVALVKGGDTKPKVFSAYTASCLLGWLGASAAIRVSDRLFLALSYGRRGKALTTTGMKEVFDDMSERAGVRFSAHDFRRTFAILASLNGGARKLVAKNAGWENPGMVDYYTRGAQEIDPDDWEKCSPVNSILGIRPN